MVLFSLLLTGLGFAKPIETLSELKTSVDEVTTEYNLFQANVSGRKGVLGSLAASRLYDRALRTYMLGDYQEATILFFILIKDGSLLYDIDQHHKSQWFLIESAEALGANLILEEECLSIIKDEKHPFFTDAVRKLLELYGRTEDIAKFRAVVEKFVDTKKVKRTDKIRYTLGKSLHWQKDSEAAISMLSSIQEGSLFYEKAQYFLGGIYAGSGDYEKAIELFNGVEQRLQNTVVNDKLKIDSPLIGTATSDEQTIYELSLLAQGRVHLETAEYIKKSLVQKKIPKEEAEANTEEKVNHFEEAIMAYSKVPSTSVYFPEVVYELVWVYIKNKSWEDASRMVDTFLLGYPEHEYAIRLELIRGRIQMNAGNNEQASKMFNDTKKYLEEIDEILNALIGDEEAALQLFFSMRDSQNKDPFAIKPFQTSIDISKLPHYAKEMLNTEKDLLLVLDMSKSMLTDYEQMTSMKRDVEELSAILTSNNKLGAIQKEKAEIVDFRTKILMLLYAAISIEIDTLKKQATGTASQELKGIEKSWNGSNHVMNNLNSEDRVGYADAHQAQVHVVQNDARAQLAKVVQMTEEITDLMRLVEKKSLPPSQQNLINDLSTSLRTDLEEQYTSLKELISPTTMLVIMAYVDVAAGASTEQQEFLYKKLQKMHNQTLKPYWKGKSSSKETIMSSWNSLSEYFESIDNLNPKLDRIEKGQLGRVQDLLSSQRTVIADLLNRHQQVQGSVDLISLEASRQGFKNIRQTVTQNILKADLGLVKIQWSRYTDKEKLLFTLTEERKRKKELHKTKFEIFKDKLPEPAVRKEESAP